MLCSIPKALLRKYCKESDHKTLDLMFLIVQYRGDKSNKLDEEVAV